MAYNPLPAQGSTSWYNHYADLDHATSGVVQLDSFPGANDDAKLTAALSYAAAQTRVPWIQYPARQVTHYQGGRTPFTGMKIMGPAAGGEGTKNLEIQSGKPVNHRVTLNMGVGTNAWFHSTSQIYNCNLANLAFQSNHTAQVWDQPSGTLYAATFHSLTGYGLRHFIGRPGNKALFTQVVLSGHWQALVHTHPQFTIGGSDNSFWMGGFLNIEGGNLGGAYQIEFNGLSKTNVGMIYCTNGGLKRGIRVTGGNMLNFMGAVVEGRNANTPAYGTLMRIEGGSVCIRDTWFAYAMHSPGELGGNDQGVIQVTGGDVLIDRPYYSRANGVAETVPLLHQSGGTVRIRNVAPIGNWSGLPRVRSTGGLLRTDETVTEV